MLHVDFNSANFNQVNITCIYFENEVQLHCPRSFYQVWTDYQKEVRLILDNKRNRVAQSKLFAKMEK